MIAGSEQIAPIIGPLSTSLEGCKLFIKTNYRSETLAERTFNIAVSLEKG
jgi:hypothetical protein